MSEIDIEAVRRSLRAQAAQRHDPVQEGYAYHARTLCGKAEDIIDQLSKENERLKAKLLESGEGANAVDRELGKVMRERDEALTKLAAMQEAIVEAVRRAEGYGVGEGSLAGFITATLRKHLPTPEPKPVDPLVEAMKESQRFVIREDDVDKLRAALSARGLEVRKIGEGAA
ncbi:hypothetical protein F1640_14800 [Novosphingobium sp. NBM11]|uniref:hypothetical protein n=1 Tax=Novosphingobium sp. NBM11 TaxID=2596914 RepID=UPI0018923317|nr:hypothetical protein [Novosphingobium sp. NBM11]MBF5091259.1 hypothetical protein [Novosphingobium sp. NBM11]